MHWLLIVDPYHAESRVYKRVAAALHFQDAINYNKRVAAILWPYPPVIKQENVDWDPRASNRIPYVSA